jgi:mono/diheme cytochrome c family protein
MTQYFHAEGRENRAMPMEKLLIRVAVSVLLLGASSNMAGHLALASDGGSQSADNNTSSGTASVHPTGDNKRGEELYKASCVVCHGPGAAGGIGPRLAGNPILSNEQAFWKMVYEGQHVMPPLKGVLTEQQIADIQAWLKTLR